MHEDFLVYLLAQQCGTGTEDSKMAAYIGRLDVQSFEAEQALKEVEDFQEQQYNAWLAQREAE